ncbi:MAG: 2-C-methyl-D-erythritol 2,4-cyclodiphosphate synthase [Bacillota bacterium]|nr:2-C-methyl-D-erythritol 2,4-cyclodiphosphate synthase [Bacillota bacterium]
MRIGSGYDVHRLVPGRPLILGGVEIPYERGLDGHSDADVLTHVVMDAILGALALGDIGKHFPDTDPAYKGADSIALLRHVTDRMLECGYQIGNLDATIVAQRPKMSPYIPQMREILARTLQTSVDRVNVKATTTEGLGFEGEGLGISSQAVVLLARKG